MKSKNHYEKSCVSCPRECLVDRSSQKLGFCKTDNSFNIASICLHRGEEPVICGQNGICNIFFYSCNLQCVYCQNSQISSHKNKFSQKFQHIEQILNEIDICVKQGAKSVGFVSPSHLAEQVKLIIESLRENHFSLTTVYNSNAYDSVETLQKLENYIDVYLPDFKYMDSNLAKTYSQVLDYPEVAAKAIREMYRQKGSSLRLDDDGNIESGLIVRHLVLPNHIENSISVLKYLAEEISPLIYVSLMSQYYPTENVRNHSFLNRRITKEEYEKVISEMENLGIFRGWVQELESFSHYRPDFDKKHPFE